MKSHCNGREAYCNVCTSFGITTPPNSCDSIVIMAPRVFLITGCYTGFGEEFVKVVLQKGDYVVATARNSSKLSFEGANDSNSLLVDLDVTKKESIDNAFDAAIKKFKKIDVVCNNAGYGLNGPFETLSEKQIRQQWRSTSLV